MSKHREISDRMKRIKQGHNDRLDALAQRMDKHESVSDSVYRSYEGFLEEKEADMKEMEQDIREMRNAVSEEAGETAAASFPSTQPPINSTG